MRIDAKDVYRGNIERKSINSLICNKCMRGMRQEKRMNDLHITNEVKSTTSSFDNRLKDNCLFHKFINYIGVSVSERKMKCIGSMTSVIY
jgi:hypothetical protein